MTLGEKVKERRTYGPEPMSQRELARRAKTSNAYIWGIEKGHQNPSVNFLMRLAKALDVDPASLLPD